MRAAGIPPRILANAATGREKKMDIRILFPCMFVCVFGFVALVIVERYALDRSGFHFFRCFKHEDVPEALFAKTT